MDPLPVVCLLFACRLPVVCLSFVSRMLNKTGKIRTLGKTTGKQQGAGPFLSFLILLVSSCLFLSDHTFSIPKCNCCRCTASALLVYIFQQIKQQCRKGLRTNSHAVTVAYYFGTLNAEIICFDRSHARSTLFGIFSAVKHRM